MFRTITEPNSEKYGKNSGALPKSTLNMHQFEIGNENWQQPYITTTNVFYQPKEVSLN